MRCVLPVLELLAAHPLLLIAFLLALGAGLGHAEIAGVKVGPVAVLFGAIVVASVGKAQGVILEIPEIVGSFGLILFTYTIGVISGPSFFESLRRGWKAMLVVAGGVLAAALAALAAGKALGLGAGTIGGAFSGGLTNTPAMAAAVSQSGDPVAPTVGYSITYVAGVIVPLVLATLVLRDRDADRDTPEPLVNVTVRVERRDRPTIAEIRHDYGDKVTFSRLRHQDVTGPTEVAQEQDELKFDDLVAVVGPKSLVDTLARDLGHRSSHNITTDRGELDFRRIALSRRILAGRTLDNLHLDRFGASVSRVRRGDVDIVAHDGFVVQLGDRLRVVAPRDQMARVSRHLGDSERGGADINPLGLAAGLTIGVLIGLVAVPLPGEQSFALGAGAGTLIVGLVFGRAGRIGPLLTSMPSSAASSLSELGMLTFLAYAGTSAGQGFVEAALSDDGWRIALVGLAATAVYLTTLVFAMRAVARPGSTVLAGMLGGAQTQPAVLALANERTGYDTRVAVGYALVYPAAMIAKILVVQLLVALG